jgi:hypothetical protein
MQFADLSKPSPARGWTVANLVPERIVIFSRLKSSRCRRQACLSENVASFWRLIIVLSTTQIAQDGGMDCRKCNIGNN